MPSVPIPANEQHVRGVSLTVPPLLEQVLDLEVRVAEIEQLQ